jgi:hypothetical protein
VSFASKLLAMLFSGFLLISNVPLVANGKEDRSRSEDPRVGKGDIRLALGKALSSPSQIGQELNLSLTIAYQNIPPRSRIYAHLLTIADNKWILPGPDASMSATETNLKLTGTFVDGDQSIFKIGPKNYPISTLISRESLVKSFGSFLGNQKDGEEFADAISNRPEGYDFTLAFLTSVGEKGNGFSNVILNFKVPDYPQYYDAILIAPFVLLYNEDGSPTVYIDAKNMTSVKISVNPNRPKPPPTENKASVSAGDIPGMAAISGYRPANAVLATGRANDIEIRVRYKHLPPGTAIYVAPIPNTGDRYVFGGLSTSMGSLKAVVTPEFVDGVSELFRIPPEGRPLFFSLPFFGDQKLEAAIVAVINNGEGEVTASMTFTPPSYARRYERIELMLLLLVPTKQGLRLLIDGERLSGAKLLVSEG